jgi:MFS transporter, FHS family, glucose/mannose:H+ symporter
MRAARLKVALVLTYMIYAVLLNSVGTVILQSIASFDVTKVAAATLEGAKDLSIAITSFLVAAQLPRFGLRRGMILGLLMVATGCIAMPLVPGFGTAQLLFLLIGVSFALVKVGVYAFVGLLAGSEREHASLLNLIEGFFMLGVLGGYWLFSGFIDPEDPANLGWLNVYYLLAALAAAAAALLALSPFDESAARAEAGEEGALGRFLAMLRIAAKPLTLIFVVSIFLYVLVEQGLGSWLPTFNRERLGLDAQMSVQAASIFAIGLAAGRLGAGLVARRLHWRWLLLVCLAGMTGLLLLALPMAGPEGRAVARWSDAPMAAFVLPLIGVFMGPIYPALNSAILSAMPRHSQPAMVGLIVVFSALGGTTGSLIVGRMFEAVGGASAFALLLLPILLLAGAVVMLARATARILSRVDHRPPAEAGS